MRTGKLPPEMLARLLGRIPRRDPRVLIGSGIGEDAAALDFMAGPTGAAPRAAGDRVLVAKTDPITFATDLIGWYAVHVNANDVACTGATPRWFLASALLPETWEEDDVRGLFDQLVDACGAIGVELVGGHTEVTGGLDRPIITGCMLGEVERSRIVRTGGGQPGDSLILTQGLAIEGTAVLAREQAETLRAKGMPADAVERAQRFLFEPGISVVAAARALREALPPDSLHSLHDPTEGGLASGVWEVAEASRTGALVDEAAIAVFPETRAVCEALDVRVLGLLASGAMLAAVAPKAMRDALAALAGAGIPARTIGTLTERGNGVRLRNLRSETVAWPHFERDEIARRFDEG